MEQKRNELGSAGAIPRWRFGLAMPCLWVELFALANIGCLAPDIYLAHSTNEFRHWAEWIPFYFSLTAPLFLVVGLAGAMRSRDDLWRLCGHLAGSGAVGVGVAGLILHLDSHFFGERTLDSLVYTAPFAAPLAYTGLGLLLIMNRMVSASTPEWSHWVILLALGGFVGNFIFSLADHAQNGFFHWTEWIPVAASALAIGFLSVPFVMETNRSFVRICTGILGLQVIVGLFGFYLHNHANLQASSPSLLQKLIDGAPPLAPLLFPNWRCWRSSGWRGSEPHRLELNSACENWRTRKCRNRFPKEKKAIQARQRQ